LQTIEIGPRRRVRKTAFRSAGWLPLRRWPSEVGVAGTRGGLVGGDGTPDRAGLAARSFHSTVGTCIRATRCPSSPASQGKAPER